MKTIALNVKWIMLTLLFSVMVTGIFAQGGNDPQNQKQRHDQPRGQNQERPLPPGPPEPPAPPDMDQPGDFNPPPFFLPDLTDDQKDKIHKVELKQIEAMTPLKNQMKEKRARLNTIVTTMPVDLKGAELMADEIGKITASMIKVNIKTDQEIRALLTPDQQVLFDARPKPFMKRR